MQGFGVRISTHSEKHYQRQLYGPIKGESMFKIDDALINLHNNPQAREDLLKKRSELRQQIADLSKELSECTEALNLDTVVNKIHNGVPLWVNNTVPMGGSIIPITKIGEHNLEWRSAEVFLNHHTKAWTLSIMGRNRRSGGEIVRSSENLDELIEVGCDWVAVGEI
jgi:hypothetical protein